MIGRQVEPVRIVMRADKPKLVDRVFQLRELLHPKRRVDAGQARKAIRDSAGTPDARAHRKCERSL